MYPPSKLRSRVCFALYLLLSSPALVCKWYRVITLFLDMILHGCIVRLNLHFTLSYRFGKSMRGSGEEKMNQCSVCEYNKESGSSSIFVSLKGWQCSMQTDWNSLIPKFLIPFFFFFPFSIPIWWALSDTGGKIRRPVKSIIWNSWM